jgi:hypothetical protein
MSWLSTLFGPKPFLESIMSGRVRDVRRHLRAGVNPNDRVDNDTGIPLFYALHNGPEMVQLLIEHGARVDARETGRSKSTEGRTPLHLAAECGYADVVRVLAHAGADVNARDGQGHTAMFAAAYYVSSKELMAGMFGVTPDAALREEQQQRQDLVKLLKSFGAVPSPQDLETAKAIGRVPEWVRRVAHERIAHQSGDVKYQEAVETVGKDYQCLYDAYRQLLAKPHLSDKERIFVEQYLSYESQVAQAVRN